MPSERQRQQAPELLVYDFQRARSIIRERLDYSGASPEAVKAAAQQIDPWLFSEEAGQNMKWVSDFKGPVPLDIMNVILLMGQRRRDWREAPLPGDSLGRWMMGRGRNPDLVQAPHRIINWPADQQMT